MTAATVAVRGTVVTVGVADGMGVAKVEPTVVGGVVVVGGTVVVSVASFTRTVVDFVVDLPSLWNAVTVIVYDPLAA